MTRNLPDEAATMALGAELALMARPGLCILLEGDLGTGKSTLARALIRALAPQAGSFEVPSPTFTLIQSYDFTRVPVAHADLYRIGGPGEIDELGFEDLLATHLLLIEWPDRLPAPPGDDWIEIALETAGSGRIARLSGNGIGKGILARLDSIGQFLRKAGWSDAARIHLQGDASYRRYERLTRDGKSAILVDMPPRPPEPIIRDGRTYSSIAGRADSIAAVVAVSRELIARGYSAPAAFAADIIQGLALVEDFGDAVYGRMIAQGCDMTEPMDAAVAVLADMAARDWPTSVPVGDGSEHRIPRYDMAALGIEIETLPDWFWPMAKGGPIPAEVRSGYMSLWETALAGAAYRRSHWVLRDVHSPNLIWLTDRLGLRRVGLIDTQDCLLGHPAYDLASLLQDARTTIAPAEADRLFALYCGLRRPPFDRDAFAAAFVLLGAQRATKILGIFARLALRDGRREYLQHVPRVSAYLERNLEHPSLAPLRAWFETHLPHELRISAR